MANIKFKNNQGVDVIYNGINTFQVPAADGSGMVDFIIPANKLNITDTAVKDVTNYAQAQIVDANLTAENIKKDVTILGVTGTHAGGSSSIYKFYDANNVELTTHTVAGLATATQYTKGSDTTKKPLGGKIFFINGGAVEGTDDKFYVLNTTAGLATSKKWSSNTSTSISNTADGIGVGKDNSSRGLTAYSTDSGSIWEWVNGLRTNSSAGCNDWFIPSMSEQALLKDAIRANPTIFTDQSSWFTSNIIWCSVEYLYDPGYLARYWYYDSGSWNGDGKDFACAVFAVRAF